MDEVDVDVLEDEEWDWLAFWLCVHADVVVFGFGQEGLLCFEGNRQDIAYDIFFEFVCLCIVYFDSNVQIA